MLLHLLLFRSVIYKLSSVFDCQDQWSKKNNLLSSTVGEPAQGFCSGPCPAYFFLCQVWVLHTWSETLCWRRSTSSLLSLYPAQLFVCLIYQLSAVQTGVTVSKRTTATYVIYSELYMKHFLVSD